MYVLSMYVYLCIDLCCIEIIRFSFDLDSANSQVVQAGDRER